MGLLRPDLLARWALAGVLLAGGALAAAQPARDCPPASPGLEAVRAEAARERPRDRGLLWELRKDGRSSWLYGTIHLGRADTAVPGPRVRSAFAASEVVALELDPGDPELATALAAPRESRRDEQVLAGLRPRLERAAERACLPAAVLAPMLPLMQVVTLAMWEARRDGLHPELGVDLVLWGMAQATAKRVIGLETAALQMAAFTPDEPAEERELVERSLDDLEAGRVRPLMRRLIEVWAGGDEALLADYPQWCECAETEAERRFYARLNDGRNPALADKLAALHTSHRVFAGVGALHMVGPQGLPGLLRARGFEVLRVPFEPLPRTP